MMIGVSGGNNNNVYPNNMMDFNSTAALCAQSVPWNISEENYNQEDDVRRIESISRTSSGGCCY